MRMRQSRRSLRSGSVSWLKTGWPYFFAKETGLFFWVALGALLFAFQAFLPVYQNHLKILPLFCSLFLCLFFGAAALVIERWYDRLVRLFCLRLNCTLSLFLSFFILVVGYLLLASSLVSAPMAWVLDRSSFTPETITLFVLRSSNCALALALVSWLRRIPPLLRQKARQSLFPLGETPRAVHE